MNPDPAALTAGKGLLQLSKSFLMVSHCSAPHALLTGFHPDSKLGSAPFVQYSVGLPCKVQGSAPCFCCPELGDASAFSLWQRAEPTAHILRAAMCQPNPKHRRAQSQLQQLPPSQWEPVRSGLGQQGDQQALHVQDAGGRAQTSPRCTGGQEEELPLPAEQVQGQLLPQLLRA